MKKLILSLALVATAPGAYAQNTHTVVLDFANGAASYTPNELTIELGDTVQWVWANGFHSVDSFQGLFSSGAPTVGPNTYDVVFDQTFLDAAAVNGLLGTSFDFFCTPHFLSGMVGNITVALPSQPLLEISNLFEASIATVTVSRTTPNQLVGVGYSLTGQGPSNLLASACGVITAELAPPVTVAAVLLADAAGGMTFPINIPPTAQGVFVYMQGLDLASCTLSNSGAWRIR
jgi:plastocyanin